MYKLLRNSQATFQLVAKDALGFIIPDYNVSKDQISLTTTEGISLTIVDVSWANGIGTMHVDIPALNVLQTNLILTVSNGVTPFQPNPFVVQILHAYAGRFVLDESLAAFDMVTPSTTVIELTDYSANNHPITKANSSAIQPTYVWQTSDLFVTEANGYQYTLGTNQRSWVCGGGSDPYIGVSDSDGRAALCDLASAANPTIKTLQIIVAGFNLSSNYRLLVGGIGMDAPSSNQKDGLGLVVGSTSLELIASSDATILSVPTAGLFGAEKQIVSLAFTFTGSIVEFYVNQTKIGQANFTLGNNTNLIPTLFTGGGVNPAGWPANVDSGTSKLAIFDFAAYSTVKAADFIAGNAAAWGL